VRKDVPRQLRHVSGGGLLLVAAKELPRVAQRDAEKADVRVLLQRAAQLRVGTGRRQLEVRAVSARDEAVDEARDRHVVSLCRRGGRHCEELRVDGEEVAGCGDGRGTAVGGARDERRSDAQRGGRHAHPRVGSKLAQPVAAAEWDACSVRGEKVVCGRCGEVVEEDVVKWWEAWWLWQVL